MQRGLSDQRKKIEKAADLRLERTQRPSRSPL
jgi:hypothetical protein